MSWSNVSEILCRFLNFASLKSVFSLLEKVLKRSCLSPLKMDPEFLNEKNDSELRTNDFENISVFIAILKSLFAGVNSLMTTSSRIAFNAAIAALFPSDEMTFRYSSMLQSIVK